MNKTRVLCASPSGKRFFWQSLPRVARDDFRRAGNPGLTCPSPSGKQALRMVIVIRGHETLVCPVGCLEICRALPRAPGRPLHPARRCVTVFMKWNTRVWLRRASKYPSELTFLSNCKDTLQSPESLRLQWRSGTQWAGSRFGNLRCIPDRRR